ncbi:MAG: endo-1,4-beta-xylanase, partial [Firmicutes bacterium]|nr:endo-1,4-beta-xylanase [Bacillota bacterium]
MKKFDRGRIMLEFLYPKEYLPSVIHITPQKLKALGIDTIIFDIDNTLVPYWIKEPTPELEKYFLELRANGITVAVLSNSREERSKVFCRKLEIPYVYRAKKPLRSGMLKLLDNVIAAQNDSNLPARIDVMGMQSHISKRTKLSDFERAIDDFTAKGLDVQVTELDIATEEKYDE